MGRRTLDDIGANPQLHLFEAPFEIPPFDFTMVWHQRKESDPAHAWLRQMIMHVASTHGPEAGGQQG